jgi:hypothetical protein
LYWYYSYLECTPEFVENAYEGNDDVKLQEKFARGWKNGHRHKITFSPGRERDVARRYREKHGIAALLRLAH